MSLNKQNDRHLSSNNTAEIGKHERKETWKPLAAGIIDIIGSAYLGFITARWLYNIAEMIIGEFNFHPAELFSLLVFLFIIIGILGFIGIAFFLSGMTAMALMGGIFAIKRKKWGLALAGSIAVFLSPLLLHIHWLLMEYSDSLHPYSWIAVMLLGAIAIILSVFSRKEFNRRLR